MTEEEIRLEDQAKIYSLEQENQRLKWELEKYKKRRCSICVHLTPTSVDCYGKQHGICDIPPEDKTIGNIAIKDGNIMSLVLEDESKNCDYFLIR